MIMMIVMMTTINNVASMGLRVMTPFVAGSFFITSLSTVITLPVSL